MSLEIRKRRAARIVRREAAAGRGVHAVPIDQVEQHAGVDRAAAGAHHEPVQGREAHRRGDAPAVAHRAHAGAVAQVRDHGAPCGRAAVERRQHRGDVFVGQAVKAVAAHAFLGEAARQGEGLRHLWLRPVKRGVEAGDLRHTGAILRHRLDGGHVVRLVQRRQRDQRFQLRQRSPRRRARARRTHAAMHDAMPDGDDAVLAERTVPTPGEKEFDRALMPSWVPDGHSFSPTTAVSLRAMKRGGVSSPSSWPRSSGRGGSRRGRRRTSGSTSRR